MNEQPESFTSLQQAIEFFSDKDRAHDCAVRLRWPNGVACPMCGTMEPTFLAKYYRWKCRGCKKQFTVKVGTLMEDSPLPLKTWMAATWLITNAKNGISSCEVARALTVTQKSAWFLLHRVRNAMHSGSFEKFSGPVEADEMFHELKVDARVARKEFKDNPEDPIWIRACGDRGWVIVTGDLNILKTVDELDALIGSDANAIFIDSAILGGLRRDSIGRKRKPLKRWEQVQWFLKHWRKIEAEVESWTEPQRIRVDFDGKIGKIEGDRDSD